MPTFAQAAGSQLAACWIRRHSSALKEATYFWERVRLYMTLLVPRARFSRSIPEHPGWLAGSSPVGIPRIGAGAISVRATNSFQAANGLFRLLTFRRENGQLELMAGYRFCQLDDDLSINESLEAAGPTTIALFDSFDTKNVFHGADLGMAARYYYDRWSLDALIKVAFGNSQSTVVINGATTTTVGGSSARNPGGFLAQPTNMGTYVNNQFAMIPELGLTLGYEVLPNLRATFGYTLIYWSKVARPGDQIDTELNLSQYRLVRLSALQSRSSAMQLPTFGLRV